MTAIEPPDASGPSAVLIGAAVREERMSRGMSTRALAAAAGISQPFLTNVENGRVTPSISSLYGIARALGVPASALLPEQPVQMEVVRAGAGRAVPTSDRDGGGSTRMLSGAKGRALEAYRFSFPPGFTEESSYAHEGEDFVHVLAGTLVFGYEDHGEVTLAAGDSVWIDARNRHTWAVPAAQTGATDVMLVTTTDVHRGRQHP